MDTAHKINGLRLNLKKYGVDGLIIPHADEYQNEFIPPNAERLAWLTGFTGSAGYALVLEDRAYALSDGRYTIQLKSQIDAAVFEAADSTKMAMADFIASQTTQGQTIGYDPKVFTLRQIQSVENKLKDKGVSLKALKSNPVDDIWVDRPSVPMDQVQIFSEEYAGKASAEKRLSISQYLRDLNVKAAVITLPDSIAWLLNIRGSDVSHNPVALSTAILHDDGQLQWFIEAPKVGADVLRHIGNTVEIFAPGEFEAKIALLKGSSVLADPQRSAKYFFDLLATNDIKIREEKDPCILPKAIKTDAEQEAMISAHVRDGAAVTKFLYWLSTNAQGKTEVEIADKLAEFRRADPLYRDSSFDTICGWAANGAIVHYRAEEKTAATINGFGLLLIDSGGQYADGTTDITRTVAVGTPTAEMINRFTLVLKGHIALASAQFPQGTTGAQLDTLARQSLWRAGLDYAHGTGHGVGCYLSVHEEAASISPRGHDPVLPGMIISNEPGYYKEGGYGIRIENLILCLATGEKLEDGRSLLCFGTLTLAPMDMSLVDLTLLTDHERKWLNEYHGRVRDILAPMLSAEENAWLAKITE